LTILGVAERPAYALEVIRRAQFAIRHRRDDQRPDYDPAFPD
jgi:hypothetical protein